jgi:hypothetical protein
MNSKIIYGSCVLWVSLIGLGGCSRTITVTSEQQASIQVDLVAVTGPMKEFWQTQSMTNYWRMNNPTRSEAMNNKYLYPLKFGNDNQPTKVLAENDRDQVWKNWKDMDAKYLFVLANLVSKDGRDFDIKDDAEGNKDPRRKWIPFSYDCWKDGHIRINVTKAGIEILTAPKNKRQCQCY